MKQANTINPLVNPVAYGDEVIMDNGDIWKISQNIKGQFIISSDKSDTVLTCQNDQISVCHGLDMINNGMYQQLEA
jgi:hypothetical protein